MAIIIFQNIFISWWLAIFAAHPYVAVAIAVGVGVASLQVTSEFLEQIDWTILNQGWGAFKHYLKTKYEDLIHHRPTEAIHQPIHDEIPVHQPIHQPVLKEVPTLMHSEILKADIVVTHKFEPPAKDILDNGAGSGFKFPKILPPLKLLIPTAGVMLGSVIV